MRQRRQKAMLCWLCMANAVLLGASLSIYHWFYRDIHGPSRFGMEAAAVGDAAGASGRQKQIALTFDDGPNPIYTRQLLDGLRKRGVKATFFLIGKNIDGNEEVVRQMHEDGHLIGNHSNTHVQLNASSDKEACSEIEATNQKIFEVTGEQPIYIRPPFGSWSDDLECLVPMTVVLWNVDPLDWKVQNTGKVVRHILKHVDDGSVVLLHDSYPTSVEAALEVIDTLTRQGYTFVTVDELMID